MNAKKTLRTSLWAAAVVLVAGMANAAMTAQLVDLQLGSTDAQARQNAPGQQPCYPAPGATPTPGGYPGQTPFPMPGTMPSPHTPAATPSGLAGLWMAQGTNAQGQRFVMALVLGADGQYLCQTALNNTPVGFSQGRYQVSGNTICGQSTTGERFQDPFQVQGNTLILNVPEVGGTLQFTRQQGVPQYPGATPAPYPSPYPTPGTTPNPYPTPYPTPGAIPTPYPMPGTTPNPYPTPCPMPGTVPAPTPFPMPGAAPVPAPCPTPESGEGIDAGLWD